MNSKAFTLIELLVVISILGLLSSLVLIGLQGAKDQADIGKGQEFAHVIRTGMGIDLVSEWRLNEGGGNSIADSSGYDNNGTWHGIGAHWTTAGMYNAGGLFNGTDDYVDCQNGSFFASIFNDIDDFTISTWIKPSTLTLNGVIVGQRYGTSMVFGHRTSGNLFLNMDDTRESSPESSFPIEVDKWQHVTAIFVQSNHMAYFYINGEAAGSGVAYDGSGIGSGDSYLSIGWQARVDTQTNASYFNGIIDEVQINNKALSSAEIQQLYVQGAGEHKIGYEF